ncbi:putative phage abortive infection protein [Pantoea vagans]|uniref:putative phage abortive infection protein n=1 Tax=Pantoea vagans TaxID=470934 RepID=UPI0028EC1AD2|nr:putative phage abortive infection protein [Pantoea vagans]
MKKNGKSNVLLLFIIVIIFEIVFAFHEVIWKFIDKIGALATGLALFAAMYQGYVAWKAANLTREASSQNLFQQKFNLVLEQHNNSLDRVIDWLKSNSYSDRVITTELLVGGIRGHEQLSPYMRILYHTLKSIKEELPLDNIYESKERIKHQKRYSSLVRSFIPNDVLFLIACNASIVDNKIFNIHGSESYSYFHEMLKDFDFFEHLNINTDEKISLEKSIEKVVYNTYESCRIFYFESALLRTESSDKNPHISGLIKLLSNPNFFICLAYDLKNKTIYTNNIFVESFSMNEMLSINLKSKIEKLNEEELNSYIPRKTNKIYKARIKNIINRNCEIYTSPSSSTYGLYRAQEIIDFFSSSIRYDNPLRELLIFRDDFHSTLKSLILDLSFYHAHLDLYEYSVNRNYCEIVKEVSPIIDELIDLRVKAYYEISPSHVLMNKKDELIRYVAKISNQC